MSTKEHNLARDIEIVRGIISNKSKGSEFTTAEMIKEIDQRVGQIQLRTILRLFADEGKLVIRRYRSNLWKYTVV